MKKLFVILLVVFLFGCNYLEEPKYLIRDPHFTAYKEERDALERDYLQKELTYAEFIKKRDELDAEYDKEVLEREQKIGSKQ